MALDIAALKAKAAAVRTASQTVVQESPNGKENSQASERLVSTSPSATETVVVTPAVAETSGADTVLPAPSHALSAEQQVPISNTLSNAEQLRQKISDLQVALQQQLPSYVGLLEVIHRAVINDPDTCHILSEDEIGIICAGLSRKKNIVLVEAAIKSTSRSTKKSNIADML